METLEGLRALAIERHGTQLYGAEPYITHLDEVLAVVRRHGLGVEYERAAYGHDLLDDTSTTLDEVIASFGPIEAALIYSVSSPGATRMIRRTETLRRLRAHHAGIALKGADRIANLTACLRADNVPLLKMYVGEEMEFASLFAYAPATIQSELSDLYARARERLSKNG